MAEPADTTSLTCVGCGYDLRSLADDERCPECGTPIARSRLGDVLSAAEPRWLRQIYRGQSLLGLGCIFYIGGFLVTFLMVALLGGTRYRNIVDWAYLAPHAIAVGLVLFGALAITTLDPRLSLTEQPVALRRITRGLAALAIALLIARVGLEAGATFLSFARPVLMGTFVMLIVAVTLLISRLAARIPDAKLALRARNVAWFFGVATVVNSVVRNFRPPKAQDEPLLLTVIAAGLGILVLIAAIIIMNLWWSFRKQLDACLVAAEERSRELEP